ncbi:MAG TPA: rhodanese-like domain-containing protein [Flavobacteriaceae bacterium]|nr:rhodanese-like domain-containing protein [Flavobacteriaceae bacterium]
MLNLLFGNLTKNSKVKVLSPSAFKEKLQADKAVLVDVRTPQEYRAGHIPKAINIDFKSSNFAQGFEKIDKEKPLFIYCRSGMRSMMCAKQLINMGFKEIYDLKGGYLNWP